MNKELAMKKKHPESARRQKAIPRFLMLPGGFASHPATAQCPVVLPNEAG
jgi:hypothetical protein